AVKRNLVTEAIADVGEMAHRAGLVPFLDVRVENLLSAGTHRLTEIGVVRMPFAAAGASEYLHHLVVVVEGYRRVVPGAYHVALLGQELVALLRFRGPVIRGFTAPNREVIRRPKAPDFEDQFAVPIIEDGELGIGGLAVVNVAEPPAETEDRLRQLFLVQ